MSGDKNFKKSGFLKIGLLALISEVEYKKASAAEAFSGYNLSFLDIN